MPLVNLLVSYAPWWHIVGTAAHSCPSFTIQVNLKAWKGNLKEQECHCTGAQDYISFLELEAESSSPSTQYTMSESPFVYELNKPF